MTDEIPEGVLNAAVGSPRSLAGDVWTPALLVCLGGDLLHGRLPGAVGGDLGVPALTGDDDGVELAQQRGGLAGKGAVDAAPGM